MFRRSTFRPRKRSAASRFIRFARRRHHCPVRCISTSDADELGRKVWPHLQYVIWVEACGSPVRLRCNEIRFFSVKLMSILAVRVLLCVSLLAAETTVRIAGLFFTYCLLLNLEIFLKLVDTKTTTGLTPEVL